MQPDDLTTPNIDSLSLDTLLVDIRTTLARHEWSVSVLLPPEAPKALEEFWRVLLSANLHAPRKCTSVAAVRAVHRCLIDACQGLAAVKRGDETLYFSTCDLVHLVADILTPSSPSSPPDSWTSYRSAVVRRRDIPVFILDVALMQPHAEILAVFTQLQDNVWRYHLGDPLADSARDLPASTTWAVRLLASKLPLATLLDEIDTFSLLSPTPSSSSPRPKRARTSLSSSPSSSGGPGGALAPPDSVAAAVMYLLAPIVVCDEATAAIMAASQRALNVQHAGTYNLVFRACAVADIVNATCAGLFVANQFDLFRILHDVFSRYAGGADAPPRPPDEEGGEEGGPRSVVVECVPVDSSAGMLGTVSKYAGLCCRKMSDAIVEEIGRMSREVEADKVSEKFARKFAALMLTGAVYRDAIKFVEQAWGVAREAETMCMAVDAGVVCLVPKAVADDLVAGKALFSLVEAAIREKDVLGENCKSEPMRRLPVYAAMTRLYFDAHSQRSRAWAVSIAALMVGQRGVEGGGVASGNVLNEVLPDLLHRVIGKTPLFLLMRPAFADKMAALAAFFVAAAGKREFDSAPIAGPVGVLAKKLGVGAEACLQGVEAAGNLASLCLRGMEARGISVETFFRLIRMVRWPARGMQTSGPPASMSGFTPIIEAQNIRPTPIISSRSVLEQRLDKVARRRACAVLRLFAVQDCQSLRLSPSAAMAHHARTLDMLNLAGERDAPITLAWNHPVYVSADGTEVLYDQQIAVLPRTERSPLIRFGVGAANAVDSQPIVNCASLISNTTSARGQERFAIMRQLEAMFK